MMRVFKQLNHHLVFLFPCRSDFTAKPRDNQLRFDASLSHSHHAIHLFELRFLTKFVVLQRSQHLLSLLILLLTRAPSVANLFLRVTNLHHVAELDLFLDKLLSTVAHDVTENDILHNPGTDLLLLLTSLQLFFSQLLLPRKHIVALLLPNQFHHVCEVAFAQNTFTTSKHFQISVHDISAQTAVCPRRRSRP